MELILTVSNLKNEYSHLILESSLSSITNLNRMVKNVRESIENQLRHQFEKVEYIKGKKGMKSHFIVSGANGASLDGYKSGGRNSVILNDDINCYLNFISQQDKHKLLANSGEVVNDFGVLELLFYCFKLRDENLSTKSGYLKCYSSFYGLNIVEDGLSIEKQRSSDINLLSQLVRKKLREQAGKYLEWTLKNNEINYFHTYYKIVVEENKDGKKIEIIIPSNENEYNLYKQKYSEKLAQLKNFGQKNRQAERNAEKMIIEEYGYKLIFRKYVFYDNQNLRTDNFDLKSCKKRLFDRIIESVTRKQSSFVAESEIDPNEYVDFRLLKCNEFDTVMTYFYESIFQYSSVIEEIQTLVENLDNIMNINMLLEKYQESINIQSIELLREMQGNSNISEGIKSLAKDKYILNDEKTWRGLTDWMKPVTIFDYIRLKQSTDKIIILCFNDKIKTVEMKDELVELYEEIYQIYCRQGIKVKNNEELLNQLPYGIVKELEIVMNKYEQELQSKYYYDSSFEELTSQFIA